MCMATVQSQSTTVDGLVCLFVVVVYRAGVVLKIWVFHGGRRMRGGSIDWKNTEVFARGVGQFDLCWSV